MQPVKNANDPPGEYCSSSHRRCLDSVISRALKKCLLFFSECVEAVDDEEPSLGAFPNHTGPVHGLQVHKGLLYTCSGDNTARAYSLTVRRTLAHCLLADLHTHLIMNKLLL